MLRRRQFLFLAAAAPAAMALPASAQPAHPACLPAWPSIPTRAANKIEVIYKTKHGQPNGLAVTDDPNRLWVLDQGAEHWVTLTDIKDGSTIREFKADVVGPSGLVQDGDTMWITSTHNSIIVHCDLDGKTIAKYVTPGAGRIYQREDDPPDRRSPLKPAWPDLPRGIGPAMTGNVGNNTGHGLPPGQLPLDAEEGSGGTGAHGIILDGDAYLIYACPPSRLIFTINKKTWKVKATWPVPGNRPHGLSWGTEKRAIWSSDSNLNAFFRHDPTTGNIVERIQLPSDSPVIHGAKLVGDYMYYCDDMGWMARFRI
jgi:DNA-binding beta-propeller fold protein YncE